MELTNTPTILMHVISWFTNEHTIPYTNMPSLWPKLVSFLFANLCVHHNFPMIQSLVHTISNPSRTAQRENRAEWIHSGFGEWWWWCRLFLSSYPHLSLLLLPPTQKILIRTSPLRKSRIHTSTFKMFALDGWDTKCVFLATTSAALFTAPCLPSLPSFHWCNIGSVGRR
jgi:hypothetical protein